MKKREESSKWQQGARMPARRKVPVIRTSSPRRHNRVLESAQSYMFQEAKALWTFKTRVADNHTHGDEDRGFILMYAI